MRLDRALLESLARSANGVLVELRKSAAIDQLELDMVAVLERVYQEQFGRPAEDLLSAALELMPEVVPGDRSAALVDQLITLGEGVDLTLDDRRALEDKTEQGYRLERQGVARQLAVDVTWGLKDQEAVDWLGKETPFWIGRHYDLKTSEWIRSAAREVGLEAGLGVDATADMFQDLLGRHYQRSRAYWELLATNAITRARNFGGVESFVQGRILEVEVVAVMDGRTSEICRELNGTVYQVQMAVQQRDQVLGVDPDGLRQVAPWPSLSQVQELVDQPDPAAALSRAGIVIPPYHGNCRTFLAARM